MKRYLARLLLKFILWRLDGRSYDFLVDADYMERWYLIPRNRFLNIYFHHFFGSDAPTPHDHPWISMSFILDGVYMEHTPEGDFLRETGDITFRTAKAMHWIEIANPVYTLFITGPRTRVWGFQCPDSWVSHVDYIKRRGADRLANGCGEYTQANQ